MPKVAHPRRAKTAHRSIQEKYSDYDSMTHSTWKGAAPKRATVSMPGKKQGIMSQMFSGAKKAAGSAIRGTAKGVRGLLTESYNKDPNAAQRKRADKKQTEMVGIRDLTVGLQRADLIAGIAKSIAKK